MKHVVLDYHFIRELVQSGFLHVSHVAHKDQLVDALTKPVSHRHLAGHSSNIGLSTGRSSCGGYTEGKGNICEYA